MTTGEKIKKLRISNGISQVAFADRISVSKQTLYKYENNIISNIPFDKIETIALFCNVTPGYLMGWDEEDGESHHAVRIPVLGSVAAGIPIEAVEDILDWVEISPDMALRGNFFGLKIKGDSMSPRIQPGDVVIVRRQSDAESGDIVIAKINGSEVTCKKLIKKDEYIALQPLNSVYEPMYFTKRDIKTRLLEIIGKVVELRGKP